MNALIDLIKQNWLFITMSLLAIIATLSLWPAEHLPKVPGSDKTHHFIAYGALVIPLALRKPKRWLWIVGVFVAFSGAIELIQPYVNRYGEWLDMWANITGLACGIIIAKLTLHFFPGNTK